MRREQLAAWEERLSNITSQLGALQWLQKIKEKNFFGKHCVFFVFFHLNPSCAANCEVMFESLSSQAANCSLLTNWGIYKGNMEDSYAIQLTEQVTVHGEKVFNFSPKRSTVVE